ncbi:hypothetical protein G6F62_001910 [Rhizopus arrhizus]|uniref:TPR-like protein n=1 Tax=Rhizopus oryzae TaxID=64495 RepID=A0A9P6X822_RHIOR|nr:hypothetical protein G6F23_003699 [Rhizopus arrhizus]KAG0764781.1 hypothetical protein G6F24_004947 [Rhizopus arrhizus]KAG0794167.1 hypothetical protein G6F21_003065 [Rhizopus arrhizus]KAG0802223.1 hypothetical protein G6F22_000475 [Rhizopus arrhizus]KAG0810866.1 hypothetical protein G6F20_007617 [Rhizopus arrhizus]
MSFQRLFFRSCRASRLSAPTKALFNLRNVQNARYTTQKNVSSVAQSRTLRIHPLPAALISFGLICLGVGLYDHLTSDVQKFPVSVRQPLLKALYYQQNQDFTLALKYFSEAFAEALQSPELEKNGAPLTGILVQLGALQEHVGKLPEARRTLTLALRHLLGLENEGMKKAANDAIFQVDLNSLSTLEQKKVVGIAQKLGDITSAMKMDEEAERWYEWSIDHLLKVSSKPDSEYGDMNEIIFDREHMPRWLTQTNVGTALETFGAYYASRDKPDLAIDLYMRALTLIGLNSCQSAVLMNNLAESYAKLSKYEDAKLWGQKGLDLAQNPNTKKINKDDNVCDQACGTLLFNMGMLFEQTKDQPKAIQFYQSARQHGRDFKQANCIKEADRALRRIEFEIQRDHA